MQILDLWVIVGIFYYLGSYMHQGKNFMVEDLEGNTCTLFLQIGKMPKSKEFISSDSDSSDLDEVNKSWVLVLWVHDYKTWDWF